MTTIAKKPKSRWIALAWLIPGALVALLVVVLAAQALRSWEPVRDFIAQFPGQTARPEAAPIGIPAWLAWQHFLNAFFIVLIIRTGWLMRRTTRPTAYWTRTKGPFRTKNPPSKMAIEKWCHLTLDALWILNGAVFVVLLFATGHWSRVVPVDWDVIPNALSVGIQYLSLDWPTENGWIHYNALQLLAYFVTIFVAAPLAMITGLRLSPIWPARWSRIDRAFRTDVARAIHVWVMVYFVLFIIVHVTLVLATGAIRNLNHMYAVRDDESFAGFWWFAGSIVLMAIAWVAIRPTILRPIASLTGKVSR